MAKSVNKVILVGHLGKDPEVRYTASGMAVASFSVATNERFKDKDGQWQDRTEWHNLVAFDRTAEIIKEYVKKGSQIYIEGKLQTRSWEKDGLKHYKTEVVINDLVLLGGRGQSSGGGSDESRQRGASAGGNNMDQRTESFDAASATQITDEDVPF
jgi:single-strand DNA-binding protein